MTSSHTGSAMSSYTFFYLIISRLSFNIFFLFYFGFRTYERRHFIRKYFERTCFDWLLYSFQFHTGWVGKTDRI